MTGIPPLVAGLILGAALMHASWNALLKSGLDRLWSITLMCAVAAVASGVAVFFLPRPAAPAWGCAVLSAVLQIGYCRRHLAQRPWGDVTETRWRYSLMNWGHDPLRPAEPTPAGPTLPSS